MATKRKTGSSVDRKIASIRKQIQKIKKAKAEKKRATKKESLVKKLSNELKNHKKK